MPCSAVTLQQGPKSVPPSLSALTVGEDRSPKRARTFLLFLKPLQTGSRFSGLKSIDTHFALALGCVFQLPAKSRFPVISDKGHHEL